MLQRTVSGHEWTHVCGILKGQTDLLIDECCNWQTVEAIREDLPQPDVISPFALVIEAIYAVDRRALVVSPQQKEVIWVFDLHKYRHKVRYLMTCLGWGSFESWAR
jgi:hypothetical protein